MFNLPKIQILRKSKEITATLFAKPKRTTYFSFHRVDQEKDLFRIGLAIPKKKARRAIDRNRIKRLAREAFRQSPTKLHADLVIKLDAPIGRKTNNRLREAERILIKKQLNNFFFELV
jgi:ribonuclease P protein component